MIRALIFCLMFLFAASSAHAEALDYKAFGTLPMLHDGRVKPIDTFARIQLGRLHGDDIYNGMSANEWLARSLFDPASMLNSRFVKVENKRLVSALALEAVEDGYYTPAALLQAYDAQLTTVITLNQKPADTLSPFEFRYLELYSHLRDFVDITQSFSPMMPYGGDVGTEARKLVGLADGALDYFDIQKAKDKVLELAARAAKKYGTDLAKYNKTEQDIALLAFYLDRLEKHAERSEIFRVVPAFLHDEKQWYSPWHLLREGYGSPQGNELLAQWEALLTAHQQQDAAIWNETMQTIEALTLPASSVQSWQLDLEVFYHALQWLGVAAALYAMAALLSVKYARVAQLTYLAALGVHGLTLLARMLILQRPPVSSLYESVLFVSFTSALALFGLRYFLPRAMAYFICAAVTIVLIGVSFVYAESGDTMNVLIAVLNTNFWLATHVICITIGYAASLIAGTMGHVYMADSKRLPFGMLVTTSLIALLFTSAGTILGGIWADQSWGRFWGWDPKENGALLIVLWFVWLLHARLARQLKEFSFAAFLAVTNVIVALSWFGVNLLNVGLHSYGFTDRAAYGLGAFCLAEIIAIGLLYLRAVRKGKFSV